MAYGTALAALADPTRRRVFERLKTGPKAVGAIARGVPVSRPAVSQHLKVLKEAGLVGDRPEGTRRVYYIDPDGLGALRKWLDQFWDEALAAFVAEVEISHRYVSSAARGSVLHRTCCGTAAAMRSPAPATTRGRSKHGLVIETFNTRSGTPSLRLIGSGISGDDPYRPYGSQG